MFEIEKLIIDLETGHRGFLITGKSEFLEPYYGAKTLLFQKIEELHETVQDNPPQQEILNTISSFTKEWLDAVGTPEIELREKISRQEESFVILQNLVIEKTGKNLVDAIRVQARVFKKNEQILLEQRNFQKNIAVVVSIVCSLVIGFVTILFIVMIRHKEYKWKTSVLQKNHQLEKAKKEAEQASRSKSDFIANMSHELRTPLTAILGYSELIRECINYKEYEDIPKDLEKIEKSGQHLLAMIEDVLDFSKLNSHKIILNPSRTDIPEFLEEIGDSARILARKQQNNFELINETNLSFTTVDNHRLRQVLLNLLSNAFKFTNKGSVSLRAYNDQSFLFLEVSDDGRGISELKQSTIFEPFVQIDKKDAAKGTGLGLPITKDLVELMRGSISLTSKKGEGSTFLIKIPLYNHQHKLDLVS